MTIGVAELTFATRQIETYTAKAVEALTAGTLIYLVLCLTISTHHELDGKKIRHSGPHRQGREG